MKFVIQRVTHAQVDIQGETVGKIGKGLLVLIGVGQGDTKAEADKYIKKLLGLRIFEDENGKMKKYTIKTQKYTIIIICQVIR